jgi:hypothetical protein
VHVLSQHNKEKDYMSLNSDNLLSKVSRVSLSERVSQKTSMPPYVVMTVHFANGLQIDNFVDKRDWFSLQSLINEKPEVHSADDVLNGRD